MRYARLLPLAVLALAIACNEGANTLTDPGNRPEFSPGTGAHFSDLGASIDLTGTDAGNLLVSFRESGLGNSPTHTCPTDPTKQCISVSVTAQATAEYACLNGGGNHPKAANKETVNGPVGGTGDFPVGHNGSASGTISVAPPGPGSFSCPPGQTFVLASVTYGTILISDDSNTNTAGVQDVPVPPGTVSHTFVSFD
jgi:hypothetical protein